MSLKQQLYNACVEHITTRIRNAEALITDAREAAANETKISAGKLEIDGNNFMAISINSPIGLAMRGLKTGDNFHFNNRDYIIENLS